MTGASLYETDFHQWAQQQARLLRAGRFGDMDVANLIEEVEDMGKRQKQELVSRLRILLMHLLKWQYEPEHRSKSWSATIKVQRFDIREHLEQNPSLQSMLEFAIAKAWKGALVDAESETGMDMACFPQQCPWTFAQCMDANFWPQPQCPDAATAPE